jgi:transposase
VTCRPAKELVLSKEKPIPYQPPLPPNEAPSGVDAAAGVTPVGLRPPFVTPAAAHSHPDCRGIPILIVAPHWKAHQGRIDASRLVFIDETWIKTNMAPLRGWGPSGQRLEASAPFGHWKTMTFIAALRYDRISAPWVIDGPINGELFTLYVEEVLAPTLTKGEVVILDNLGSHKGKSARNAIRTRGAHLLFLPPYSPDLNPIEQVFAKLKHLLRAAEPRDVEATWRKVGELLDLFSNQECANYFRNSGYVSV